MNNQPHNTDDVRECFVPGQLYQVADPMYSKTSRRKVYCWPFPVGSTLGEPIAIGTVVVYLRPCKVEDYKEGPEALISKLAVVLHGTRKHVVYYTDLNPHRLEI